MIKCECIKAGDLNRRITIQSQSSTEDAYGGNADTYSTLVQVWAKMEYGSASEKYAADRLTSFSRVEFAIRYRTDVTAKMRIVDDENKHYEILAVQEDGQRKFTIILAEERV